MSLHEHMDTCLMFHSLRTRNGYGVWYSMGQHCTWWNFTARLWIRLYRQVHGLVVEIYIYSLLCTITTYTIYMCATLVRAHSQQFSVIW